MEKQALLVIDVGSITWISTDKGELTKWEEILQ